MTYPQTHYLMVMSGPLYAAERWSAGIRLSNPGGFEDEAAQQTLCDDVAAVVNTWWTGQSYVGSSAGLDLVKVNLIGSNGRYVNQFTAFTELLPARFGTHAGLGLAPQLALAVTLQTARVRGLATRGRFYLPAPHYTPGSDGRISTAQRDTVRTSVVTFLNNLNQVRPGMRAIVASDVGAGAINPVTAVAVGRVLDTIRSRRHALEEDRASTTLAAPA